MVGWWVGGFVGCGLVGSWVRAVGSGSALRQHPHQPTSSTNPLTTRAVVTSWPTWRWVCSAAWKSRPSTVEGSRARPTSRGSSSVAGSVARSCVSARSTAASKSATSTSCDAVALVGPALLAQCAQLLARELLAARVGEEPIEAADGVTHVIARRGRTAGRRPELGGGERRHGGAYLEPALQQAVRDGLEQGRDVLDGTAQPHFRFGHASPSAGPHRACGRMSILPPPQRGVAVRLTRKLETMVWEERWHPLRREWVIVSSHRNDRPGSARRWTKGARRIDPTTRTAISARATRACRGRPTPTTTRCTCSTTTIRASAPRRPACAEPAPEHPSASPRRRYGARGLLHAAPRPHPRRAGAAGGRAAARDLSRAVPRARRAARGALRARRSRTRARSSA